MRPGSTRPMRWRWRSTDLHPALVNGMPFGGRSDALARAFAEYTEAHPSARDGKVLTDWATLSPAALQGSVPTRSLGAATGEDASSMPCTTPPFSRLGTPGGGETLNENW